MKILAWLLRRGNWPPDDVDAIEKDAHRARQLELAKARERRIADQIADIERQVLTHDRHHRY